MEEGCADDGGVCTISVDNGGVYNISAGDSGVSDISADNNGILTSMLASPSFSESVIVDRKVSSSINAQLSGYQPRS